MKILVVGSGPSGVHFALSALQKRHHVTLVDVGRPKAAPVLPDGDFTALKRDLSDPAAYFLGEDYQALTLPAPDPDGAQEYYGLPPSKDYVFQSVGGFAYETDGLDPLVSFAAGGLAESWTAGCYPLNDAELSAFPVDYAALAPHYGEVARRIGVAGEADDLSAVFPPHDNLSDPLILDASSASLLAAYGRKRERLVPKHDIRFGRSRQAVLVKARDDRGGCRYCGRCLWGCPNGAFYTPSLTLTECLTFPNFTYRSGRFASHFELSPSGEIARLVAYPAEGGAEETFEADAYVLACGALSSSNLVLRSIYKATGEIVVLDGLMDNRQVLAPFFNLAMLGKAYDPATYQYHQLAVGLADPAPERYVHGQVTTLKTGQGHPIFQNLPLDLRSAIGVFGALRSGLGVVNLNFCDTRRAGNHLTLSKTVKDADGWPILSIRYRPREGEAAELKRALSRVGRFFAEIGAPLVPGMAHVRPMGSSVHYSGTLPMSAERKPWSVSPNGQSHDIANLFVVDGAAMPFLPAKNLTFTLMANAARIAAGV